MTQAGISVNAAVTVDVPVERAFAVFTDELGTWWPPDYHIGEKEPVAFVIEPRQGGRWFERAADGTECDTGRVLVWRPPHQLTLAWHLNGNYEYDPDPSHASEVDIRFIAEGEGRTRVEVEHRAIERHGATAEALRESVASDGGWTGVLQRYAAAAATKG
jgi:uncharacterized protein YndB with AHSA1/START domain